MLPTQAIIEEVIAAKQQYNFQLIVDPIIVSGSGHAISRKFCIRNV